MLSAQESNPLELGGSESTREILNTQLSEPSAFGGTRVAEVAESHGYRRRGCCPCVGMHDGLRIHVLAHGDDFHSVSDRTGIEQSKGHFGKALRLKCTALLGWRTGCGQEARTLHRCIRVTSRGWEYEALCRSSVVSDRAGRSKRMHSSWVEINVVAGSTRSTTVFACEWTTCVLVSRQSRCCFLGEGMRTRQVRANQTTQRVGQERCSIFGGESTHGVEIRLPLVAGRAAV